MKRIEHALLRPLVSFRDDNYEKLLESGNGYMVQDATGKSYIDLISGLWNVPFGYDNYSIKDAITTQLNQLPYINSIHECADIQVKYAEKLKKYIGEAAERVFFTSSGSESNEFAIKFARKYQFIKYGEKKAKILIFDHSYHGTTYAAMSASGMDSGEMLSYEPIVEGFVKIETPLTSNFHKGISDDEYREKIINQLNEVFEKEKGNIAGILFEPVIASGGVFELPKWYVDVLVKLCNQHDVIIIADEVATGFMRTGVKFAYMRTEIKPDIICLSKAIVNGYLPFGAVTIGKKVAMTYTEKNEYVEHFTTQNGNLIAPAAAIKVIDLLEDPNILENIKMLIKCLNEYDFTTLLGNSYVREVRRVGLMIAIDLIKPDGTPLAASTLLNIVNRIRDNGILVYEYFMEDHIAGISLFPPYILKKSVIEKSFKIIQKKLLLL